MKNQIKFLFSLVVIALLIFPSGCKEKITLNPSSENSSAVSENPSSDEVSDIFDDTSDILDDSSDIVDSSGITDDSSGSMDSSSQQSSAGGTSSILNSSSPPTPTVTRAPFNEDEFPSITIKTLSIIHFVSSTEFKALQKKGETDQIWSAIGDFQKKYAATVKVTSVPWANLVTKTVSLQTSNMAPDLLVQGDTMFPATAASNVLQALENLQDNTGKKVDFRKNLWDTTVMNAFKYNNKTYAISGKNTMPYFSIIYYNETLFKQASLTTPKDLYKQGKWTWAEFAKAARKLTKDTDSDGVYDQMGFSTWGLIPSVFALSNDTSIIKLNSSGKYVANLTDPKMLNTLNFIFDGFKSPDNGGWMTNKGTLSFDLDFAQGKLAMVFGNPVPSTVKFDWDAVPFPIGPDNTSNKIASQIFGYGIPTGAKNPQGALAFLYMLNDPKYIKPIAQSYIKQLSGNTGGIPDPVKGQWNFSNYRDFEGPARSLTPALIMDRSFSDCWSVYWYLCADLEKGELPATVATKYQQTIQANLDKSFGG